MVTCGYQLWSDKNALRLIALPGTQAMNETFVASPLASPTHKEDQLLLLPNFGTGLHKVSEEPN